MKLEILIVLLILAIIMLIFIIASVIIYNKLKRLSIEIEKEYSNLDVSLKKRSDLIPKLVDVVKAYSIHEHDTLTKLVEMRNKVVEAKDKLNLSNSDYEVTNLLKNLFAIVENYPELKASSNYLDLQNELSKVEEDLAVARKRYNHSVLLYNNKYLIFPINIIANMMGFRKQNFFKISDEEKEVPNIDLD